MVFPSLGCQTCKKRRIRCDFARPNCSRCSKANRLCIWDRNLDIGISFRSENDFAQGKLRRPRKVPKATRDARPRRLDIISLTNQLSIPLEVYAFNYWKEAFTTWPEDLSDVSLEYGAHALHDWDLAQSNSSLHLAVTAFSLAIFGCVKHLKNAVELAHHYYYRSCTHVRREIQQLSNENIDQVLTATMFLATYDVCSIIYTGLAKSTYLYAIWNITPRNIRQRSMLTATLDADNRWDVSHNKGTAALILARTQQQYHQNMPLDMALRRPIIRECIVYGVPVLTWLQFQEPYSSLKPESQLDYFMIQVADLRSRFINLTRSVDNVDLMRQCQCELLALEAEELDSALGKWPSSLSEDWKFENIVTPSMQWKDSLFLYESSWRKYTTHKHAVIWNRYRTSRLVVLSIRVQLLSSITIWTDLCVNEKIRFCHEAIDLLIADMCRSVGFFFAPFYFRDETRGPETDAIPYSSIWLRKPEILPKMATVLAWPLAVAHSIEAVSSSQKLWLRFTLQKLSDIIGAAVSDALEQNLDFEF